MTGKICPACGSENLFYNENKGFALCLDCGEKFGLKEEAGAVSGTWNQDLTGEAYWCRDFCLEAPVSLALSYQRLYDYIKEGNIGCTLFLIRDVFELMVKIPVIIMFNGVHELVEKTEDVQALFVDCPAVGRLYDYSLQMLVTGKWFECLRVTGGIKNDTLFEPMYQETIRYCRQIKDLFYFNHTSMVTWRNRTVGHSCLAVVPESNYRDIPDILKMFRRIAVKSLDFYKKLSFADHKGGLLKGCHALVGTQETLIAYEDDNGVHYEKMNALITGHLSNLAFYDGYDRGRAFLLDYHTGDRYKDAGLSVYLRKMQAHMQMNIREDYLTSGSMAEDNLKSEDIRALEKKLQEHRDMVYIPFLYEWLMKEVKAHRQGIFLLQAERGMGKSTFADTIDQLSLSEEVLRYSDGISGWTGFMQEEAAVRVWHLNASYSSRRDILVEGLRNILLTIEPGYYENGCYIPPNRLTGALDALYGRLQSMDDPHVLRLGLADCLNQTMQAYKKYTSREKMLLVLDGIDEMSDASVLFDMLPDSGLLEEGIFILLTCRMDHELEDKKILREKLKTMDCFGRLEFGFDAIVMDDGKESRKIEGNPFYYQAVRQYLEEFVSAQAAAPDMRALAGLCYDGRLRFSTLSAYRKLYRMNPAFEDNTDGRGLLNIYFEELKKSAPSYYVRQIEDLLDTLIHAGTLLTLQELAYLSGEGYISYRFLGLLDDLQAFIAVTRSDRGNLYGLAHTQWEDEMKVLRPEGGRLFRNRCAALMTEIEEGMDREPAAGILKKGYEGEYWLLMHLPSVYSRCYGDIMADPEEKLCIGSLEKVLLCLAADPDFKGAFCRSISEGAQYGTLAADFGQMLRDYQTCIELYGDMPCSEERGLYYTSLRFYNPVLIGILKLYEEVLPKLDGDISFEKKIRMHLDIAWLKQHILLEDDATAPARQENLVNVLGEYEQILDLIREDASEEKISCIHAMAKLYGEMDKASSGIRLVCDLIDVLKKGRRGNPLRDYQLAKTFQLLADLRGKDMLLQLKSYNDMMKSVGRTVRKVKRETDAESIIKRISTIENMEIRQEIRQSYDQACMEYDIAAQMKRDVLKYEKPHSSRNEDQNLLKDFIVRVFAAVLDVENTLADIQAAADDVNNGSFLGSRDCLLLIKTMVGDSLFYYQHQEQELAAAWPKEWFLEAAGSGIPGVITDERKKELTEAMVLLEHSIADEHGPGASSGRIYPDTVFASMPKKIRKRYVDTCDPDYRAQFGKYLEACIKDGELPVFRKGGLCQAVEDYFRYIAVSSDHIDEILRYFRAVSSEETQWEVFGRDFAQRWLMNSCINARKPVLEACLSDKDGRYPVMTVENFNDVVGIWNRLQEGRTVLIDMHQMCDTDQGMGQRVIDCISGGCFSALFGVVELPKDYLMIRPETIPEDWQLDDERQLCKMVLHQSDYRKDAVQDMEKDVSDMAVLLIKAESIYDAYEAAEELFRHRSVLLNTEDADYQTAQHVVDFVSGACYCENGSIYRMGSNIFLISPGDVKVTSFYDDVFMDDPDTSDDEQEDTVLYADDNPCENIDEDNDCFTLMNFADIFSVSRDFRLQHQITLDVFCLEENEKERVLYFLRGVCMAMNGYVMDFDPEYFVYLHGRKKEEKKNAGNYICRPREVSDYEEACQMLLEGYTVLLQLEGTDWQTAVNILDAVTGCAWMLECTDRKIGPSLYVFEQPQKISSQ